MPAIIFDLDGTLADTSAVDALRTARRWNEAVSRMKDTSLFSGIPELLAELALHKAPWCVVTNSVSYYAEKLLRHHGVKAPVLVAYHDAPAKPRPDSCRLALEKLGAKGPILGVGDKLSDLRAYQSVGATGAIAKWNNASEQGAWDHSFARPSEVLDWWTKNA